MRILAKLLRSVLWFWRSERWGRLSLLLVALGCGLAFFRWVHTATVRDDRRILYLLIASWTASIAVSLGTRRRYSLLALGLLASVLTVDLVYTTFLIGTFQRAAPDWVLQLTRGAAVVGAPLLFFGTIDWAWAYRRRGEDKEAQP